MSISGHKSIAIFQRYNIVSPQQLKTAMAAVEANQGKNSRSAKRVFQEERCNYETTRWVFGTY
jgi:hypothetical protein